jgi:hypothetical protein
LAGTLARKEAGRLLAEGGLTMVRTQNLTGAEMTALWLQYQEARHAFNTAIGIRDDGTPETAGAFDRAQRAIMDAHTVDLVGIAIKLSVLRDTAAGCEVTEGILRDLAAAGVVLPQRAGG